MMLETVRIVADHLASGGADGVATLLAAVPRDSGDAAPTAPTVLDETRSLAVAIGRVTTLPALTVALDEVTDMDPYTAQGTRDAQVALVVRYVVRDATDVATRGAYYTLRAVSQSLDRLTLPSTRNDISVYSITDLRFLPPMQPLEDQWVVGGLRVVFQVRDNAP